MMILLIILGVVVIFVLFVIGIYNRLVKLRNRFKNAYAQIDVQLKRRYDLIPNLVENVRGYMKHESGTLEAVTAARNTALAASNQVAKDPANQGSMKGLVSAETLLTGALGKLMVVVESYPDLKAIHAISGLMEELVSTENKVSFARQAYNDSVMEYNIACTTFPAFLIAGPFGFSEAELFVIAKPEEREAVKVSF